MKIHRTAIVSSKAEIADDVEIGPYAVVEGEARVGPGCIIQTHAIICSAARIGRGNVIGYGAIVGGDPQDYSFLPGTRSEVVVGDDNRIREYCTIHRGTTEGSATMVGDHNHFMAGTHLGHNAKVGNYVTLANNVLLAGHVEVDDQVYVGGGSVFHQYIRVGTMSFVQGNGKFGKDIPPYTIAADHNSIVGLNFAGLRRAGIPQDQRREISQAFNLLYRAGLNKTQALEEAEKTVWGGGARFFIEFMSAAKKRGTCDLRKIRNAAAGKILAGIRGDALID
jgi:UDP-N-acetylglucosamine acyltransferase